MKDINFLIHLDQFFLKFTSKMKKFKFFVFLIFFEISLADKKDENMEKIILDAQKKVSCEFQYISLKNYTNFNNL